MTACYGVDIDSFLRAATSRAEVSRYQTQGFWTREHLYGRGFSSLEQERMSHWRLMHSCLQKQASMVTANLYGGD